MTSNNLDQLNFNSKIYREKHAWLVSWVGISISSIKKTLGESINFEAYMSEIGAKDCINIGIFSQDFDL